MKTNVQNFEHQRSKKKKKKKKKKIQLRKSEENELASIRVNIVLSGLKRAFMGLKHIYRIKKSSYLYSVRIFPFYSMWDVTNTL